MKRFLLLFSLLLLCSIAYPNMTLKSRLMKGNPGDYIVTAQGANYTIFLLRSVDKAELMIEEISVEQSNIDLKKYTWKTWVENKCPKAASWIVMAFDLEKNTLIKCYSYLEKQWLFIENSEHFVKELLNLDLRPSRDNERKRIGPPPPPGEIDRRKLWNPQFIYEGEKLKKTSYEVLRSIWPNDKTRLAGCIIEMYLDAERPNFPFPYWMEVQSPHYTLKLSTIDSGTKINSPMPKLM